MGYKLKNVYLVNKSTVVTNTELNKMALAIQKQVQEHFAPAWGISAYVKVVNDTSKIQPTSYNGIIYIVDTPDQKGLDGVLGYHDYLDSGQPIGYVFAAVDKKYGLEVSVTLSHEVLEMLGDVFCNWSTLVDINRVPTLIAIEVCDPVEDDSEAYLIDGVKVSNFVMPDWFEPNSKAKVLDYLKLCKAPLEIRPGGYIAAFRIGKDKGWINIEGPNAKRLHIKEEARPEFTRTAKRNKILLLQENYINECFKDC